MENLGIDPKLLIAQIINFALFYIVFRKFIAKPFMRFISDQKTQEKEKERLLVEAQKKYDKIREEEEKAKDALRHEREAVLEETKKAAEEVKKDLVIEAKREADEIVEKAKKQMEAEREALYSDVKKKTVDLSIFIIDQALKEYLTADVQKKVTTYIMKNMGKEVKNIEKN